MRIVVFGADRCNFCKKQLGFLKNTFSEDDVLYVDIIKDTSGFKIAEEMSVEHLPTILILDNKNRELFRKSGTLPADRIFKILNKEPNSIPVKKSASGRKVVVSLTYNPALKAGDIVKTYLYSGSFLQDMKVTGCKQLEVDLMTEMAKDEYLKDGGRLDVCWSVQLDLI